MNILNIETSLSSSAEHKLINSTLQNHINFIDYDMIFWNFLNSIKAFKRKWNIVEDQENKVKFFGILNKYKADLDEYFKIGRILVMEFPFEENAINDQNNKITNSEILQALHLPQDNVSFINGTNIEPIEDETVTRFYSTYKDFFTYRYTFNDSSIGYPLMYIKDTKKVVAKYMYLESGLILFLPTLSIHPNDAKRFIDDLHILATYLIKSKSENSAPTYPDWIDQYLLKGEENKKAEYDKLLQKQQDLNKKINEVHNEIDHFRYLKTLFASDGKYLENTVEFIFKDFGFTITPTEENKDDLIVKKDDLVAVIEVKGLKNSAAEKNAAQLEKWVSNYQITHDKLPKGILVVNTFKNQLLEERKGEDFPNQMMGYCKAREHCLITGVQLLCLYLDYKIGNIKLKEIDKLLFDTVGVLNYKEDYSGLIKKIVE